MCDDSGASHDCRGWVGAAITPFGFCVFRAVLIQVLSPRSHARCFLVQLREWMISLPTYLLTLQSTGFKSVRPDYGSETARTGEPT